MSTIRWINPFLSLLFWLFQFACGVAPEARGQAASSRASDHQDLSYYLDAKGDRRKVASPGDWRIRRRQILMGMTRVMGPLPTPDPRPPLDVRMIGEVKIGALIRRKVSYQSEPGDRVSAYLFLPASQGRAGPAVLCLQQTNRKGKVEAAGISGDPNLAYALHLAERGYVTLAPDYPGFGDSTYDFKSKRYVSGTMKAIWDNTRAVDFLCSLEAVDGERIGVIGHSLGGHNAMFTAAFEPRLKAIVSSCGFTRFHKDDVPSWTGERYMPRIATVYKNDADALPFDFPEIIGSFAPRPFLAVAAKRDRDFDYTGVRDSIAAARPIYRLFKREVNLQAIYPDTPHAFVPSARKTAYEFLDRHLKR